MGKKLILAEKPSLAKDIADALGIKARNKNKFLEGDDVIVANLVGHVLEAEYEKVPYLIENLPLKGLDTPKMIIKKDKSALTKSLIEEIKRADVTEIVSAGDADQEGSLLVYELLEYAKIIGKKQLSRMWILAVDKQTLIEAYNNRYTIEKDLPFVEAAKARAYADVSIGFNFSRLATMRYNFRASIGRVRTVVQQIIKYREDEIENFVPMKHYKIKGFFEDNIVANMIIKKEANTDNSDEEEDNEDRKDPYGTLIPAEKIDYVLSHLKKDSKYKVKENKSEDKKVYPDNLCNQNDILKNASKLAKVKANQIDEAMQFLYENKFISYPRSSKKHLKMSLYPKIETVYKNLLKLYADNINGASINLNINNKNMFNDEKVEEHFAVVPWMPKTQEQIDSLTKVQRVTYDYIVSKFLMACMKPYEYTSSAIVLEHTDSDLMFRLRGNILIEKGFKNYKLKDGGKEKQDILLPPLKQGQIITLNKFEGHNKLLETKPPERLKEADLLGIMENIKTLYKKTLDEETEGYDGKFEIGTPATRTGILGSLYKQYKFVGEDEKGGLFNTPDGIQNLNSIGSAIDIHLTASFEEDMNKIQKDKSYSKVFKKRIDEYILEVINGFKPYLKDITPVEKEKTTLKCPLCGGALVNNGSTFRCEKAGKFNSTTKKFSGCQFGIIQDQKIINHKFTEDDLIEFMEGKEFSGKGNKLIFDINNPPFYTKAIFGENSNSPEVNLPTDKDGIIETDRYYKKGDVIIWKTAFGTKFTKAMATKLFNGEILELKNLVSKAGKKYDANLKIAQGKIEFC